MHHLLLRRSAVTKDPIASRHYQVPKRLLTLLNCDSDKIS